MKKLTLDEIRGLELEILDAFAALCERNHIWRQNRSIPICAIGDFVPNEIGFIKTQI
jgi:hypothetical protein